MAFDWSPVLTLAGAIGVAGITSFFTFLGLRYKSRIEGHDVDSKRSNFLINQLQEERVLFANEAIMARMEMRSLTRHVASLELHIFEIRTHVADLEQLLRQHSVPFKPFIKPIPVMEETTRH